MRQPPAPRDAGKPWLHRDDLQLADWEDALKTIPDIARLMERGERAIYHRLHHLFKTGMIPRMELDEVAKHLGLRPEVVSDANRDGRITGLFSNTTKHPLWTTPERLGKWCQSREALGILIETIPHGPYRDKLAAARQGWRTVKTRDWEEENYYAPGSSSYHHKTRRVIRVRAFGIHGTTFVYYVPS